MGEHKNLFSRLMVFLEKKWWLKEIVSSLLHFIIKFIVCNKTRYPAASSSNRIIPMKYRL
jgi:hypothetical protein